MYPCIMTLNVMLQYSDGAQASTDYASVCQESAQCKELYMETGPVTVVFYFSLHSSM